MNLSIRFTTTALIALAILCLSAQPRALAGSVVYEGHKEQFTIELPEGWTAYEQLRAITGKSSPFGMVIFASVNLEELESGEQFTAMLQSDTGDLPSFFVDRGPAKRGMSCKGMSKKAEKAVIKMLGGDVMFSPDRQILEDLHSETISIGDCQGLRIRGRSKQVDGTEWAMDVHALSDGNTLYLFSLRNIKENYDKNLEVYEEAVSTVSLAGT